MARSGLEVQARRELAFAEQRFLDGDFEGARHWAQRALDLAPGLPGAEQALAAYGVHAAAATGVGPAVRRARTDWYAVLGLLPHPRPPLRRALPLDVTHDDVKRQHRRLRLLVHPDKNPSAAADGAFKLVQAAYAALSAVHPPPPPRDEERLRFWQAAAQDDIAPPPQARAGPRQPPIGRATPRPVAPPPPGPPEQGIRLPCCQCHPPCVFSTLHRAGEL